LKILSFGAGALGTYVGGSLALAGEQLVFLEQPAVARELRRAGLHLDLAMDRRRKSAAATILAPNSFDVVTSLEDALARGPFDVAIFALKSFDTTLALRGIKPFAAQMPAVCCMSNGVDNEPAIAEVLGANKVIAATVTTAIGRRGPGSIVLEKLRGIGFASTHPLSQKLMASANAALLNPRLFANAAAMKWSKLLTNLIANATSAILDMTAADIFANSKLYGLEIGMLRECLAVMHAQGIPVVDLPGTPVRLLELAVRLPMWLSKPLLSRAAGSGRGGKMPSFHIDLHSGRGNSEVEYLNGAVVRAGRKVGIPTPINQMLTETLLALARREMPLEEFAHHPKKLLAASR
jgi:2-dehydropantoate 2-reductase